MDPVEGSPGKLLYTKKYYQMIQKRLNKGGLFVTQSGPCGVLTHNQVFTAIHKTLSSVFPSVFAGGAHIPSFVDKWGINVASPDPNFNLLALTPTEIDRRIDERITSPQLLKFYDGEAHRGLFILPKCVRDTISNETRIITEDQPLVIP